jgi:glycosyltransferase involved in cell wall biosynthesis
MWSRLVAAGAGLALVGTAHAAWNLRALSRPAPPRRPVAEPVEVLIPARDEAHRIAATVASVLAQRNVADLRVTVLDDGSSDGTAQVAQQAGGGDPRLVVRSEQADPPPGWLGKPFACQRLAAAAGAPTLVFLDADVVLSPDAVSAAVACLAERGADFASPWPRQVATGVLGRLVQPMQQWSWATTLPLRKVADSPRASLAAANGQFLVVRRSAYESVGGHGAVAGCVLEDIELARAMKRAGRRTLLLDGHELASCRMYDNAAELREGYRKSLWAAFGPRDTALPLRAVAAAGAWSLLGLAYLVPPLGLLLGPRLGTRVLGGIGTAAAVVNRALIADRTGSPVWPDSLAHPLSVAAFIGLSADSLIAHAAGRTQWKGVNPLHPF